MAEIALEAELDGETTLRGNRDSAGWKRLELEDVVLKWTRDEDDEGGAFLRALDEETRLLIREA